MSSPQRMRIFGFFAAVVAMVDTFLVELNFLLWLRPQSRTWKPKLKNFAWRCFCFKRALHSP
jgi:hypothetical protein